MKKALCIYSILVSSFLGAQFDPIQSTQDILDELNFLTTLVEHPYPPDGTHVGVAYKGSVGALNGLILPLTYYDSADYWDYVCQSSDIPGVPNDCHVIDYYHPDNYTLVPNSDPKSRPRGGPANLQTERIDVREGTSIYDAAVWQVALAVAGKEGLSLPGIDFFKVAENQNTLLQVGYDGNADGPIEHQNRATTHFDWKLNREIFSHNGQSITTPKNAYFFRYITRNWLSTDPFLGTPYLDKYVQAEIPSGIGPRYIRGNCTWQDWKPITGENVWAFFIGPLQTAYLQQMAKNQTYIPDFLNSPAIQNALNVLFGVRCMQSEIGAIYYACEGSFGNQGEEMVNPHEVAVENNVSALAGLMILHQILQDQLTYNPSLSVEDRKKVCMHINAIKTVVHGGTTPQGYETDGLLSFLKNYAWWKEEGIFYQGGFANDPTQNNTTWEPNISQKAVDVTTWGVSILGPEMIDQWFGPQAAYRAWQKVKEFGGYYVGDELWGVGFSSDDGDGPGKSDGVISAEWTAGAINMVRILLTHYGDLPSSGPGSGTSLLSDLNSMSKNVLSLRSDLYPTTKAYSNVRPPHWDKLIPFPSSGTRAFLYANKRYFIPFGWWANPLPNTTSTAWMILLQYNFNPFKIGGDYSVPANYFDVKTCPRFS